jgi:inosine/xanthosine triphosphatase
MKKVVVASTNPVKIRAVELGFRSMFPEESFHVLDLSLNSGVADQPFGNDETLQGAINRANKAQTINPDADYWVGVEGGVEEHGNDLAAFAWIVVKSSELSGKGRTGTFYLPTQVAQLIRQGKELGEADDIVFGKTNSKQDNGAVGILTGDIIDRTSLYQEAVILALIPFRRPELFRNNQP